jgi:hypothetical protein
VSADRRLFILDTRTPAVENIRPAGTKVAGTAEYFWKRMRAYKADQIPRSEKQILNIKIKKKVLF